MPPFLMNKKFIMAIVIPVVFIAGAAVIGILSGVFTGCDDCAVEEAVEEIMENQSEKLLGLDDGTMNFDLTPDSKEVDELSLNPLQRECLYYCRCFRSASEMEE